MTLGVVALSLGAVLSVGRRAIFDREAFAERLGASLGDPRVAAFVADRLADAVLKEKPDLTAFRALIVGTARGAISTSSFRALARTTARTVHASLFSEGGRTVIVSVPDVGVLLKSALGKANPSLAEKVPPRLKGVLASIGSSQVDRVMIRLWRLSSVSRRLAAALALGGVLFVVSGFVLARSPRHAVGRLGVRLLAAGVVLYLLVPAGAAIAATLPRDDLARGAAAGVWVAFAGSLQTWAFVLGGTGLVLYAAGRSLMERFDVRETSQRVLAWVSDPGSHRGRLLRALLLVGTGVVALLKPVEALELLAILLGAMLAFAGLRELFEMLLDAAPEAEAATSVAPSGRSRFRMMVVLGPACALAVALVWIAWPRPLPVRPPSDTCNGAAALCGRRLDDVVFPATHNSMSSADITEWLFPQQEKGIPGQLEDGIRALLLDVHYGIPVEGRVKTDVGSEAGSIAKIEKAVGREGLEAAARIRARLAGKDEGPRGLYLCHGFCELGATPFKDTLERIYEFLVTNPDEVLLLVVEDYVSPEDLASAFAETGLDSLVYRGPAKAPWPTLREMVDSRQRVLVLIESGRTGVPWIHPAFEVMQETPYHFEQPSELSCEANRGGTSGSLFLVNNWIDTTPAPRPSNAAIVNAYDALLARARQCQAARNRRPTVLAVDFYRTGELFRAARALNGLEGPASP